MAKDVRGAGYHGDMARLAWVLLLGVVAAAAGCETKRVDKGFHMGGTRMQPAQPKFGKTNAPAEPQASNPFKPITDPVGQGLEGIGRGFESAGRGINRGLDTFLPPEPSAPKSSNNRLGYSTPSPLTAPDGTRYRAAAPNE